MRKENQPKCSKKGMYLAQAAPYVEAGASSLVITWTQGNRMHDIQKLLEEYDALLAQWGFHIEDVMALVKSRACAKPGAGLWLVSDCGGQVSVTPLGLS